MDTTKLLADWFSQVEAFLLRERPECELQRIRGNCKSVKVHGHWFIQDVEFDVDAINLTKGDRYSFRIDLWLGTFRIKNETTYH